MNRPEQSADSGVGWSGSQRPRVVVLGPGGRRGGPEVAQQICQVIAQHADIVLSDPDFKEDLSQIESDLAVVLGGDGSMLRSARQMHQNQIPTLGVNLGRLGFLAAVLPTELPAVFPAVCQGQCRVVSHLMLQCAVLRDGRPVAEQVALNEVAILGGPPYSILNVDLYVDSDWATTYSCDGLIISTPVGSTAHSLSAGGPILRKNLQAVVISPISPHTLTVRPVVDDADHCFEMVVSQPQAATAVVVDGRSLCQLMADDRVRVQRADSVFKMIEVPGQNDYRTLREKLGWRGSLPTNGD